ncbi:UDP-glucose/GDP-mannose dehydrogenase family protein [Bdellovibrio sp. HCB2-146]|uniref:UDP-glucose/GDP-mannose dehydrogenase family protein n=1 Tax=Bdellovibrio sp. HCB2-146 TaxID=3394362 RepID=UPI0039BD8A5F
MKIGFIGLGKLGLPCAEVMAGSFNVVGFDTDKKRHSDKFSIVGELSEAVRGRDLVFVAVPTPHHKDYDGSKPSSHLPTRDFDYTILRDVISAIARYEPQARVVVISTVLPGVMRSQIAPLLPQGQVIYNPYFIAMGTVKEDFLSPEMVPIGTSNGESGAAAVLISLYQKLVPNARLELGTYEEAESIKIFYNTFISFKIGFVNTILDVALKVGHMDVDRVTGALAKSTQRLISPSYLKAGLGDGGPCHPRDNIALSDIARRLDLGYDLFGAIMQSREAQAFQLAQFLRMQSMPVLIAGVAFKPHTTLTDGSYSLLVSHYLEESGEKVHLYDPDAGYESRIEGRDVAVLLAHTHLYERIKNQIGRGSVVIDPWRSGVSEKDFRTIPYGNTREPA